MTLVAVLFGVFLILKAAPDTALARFLNRWLVRQPADALNRVSRGQVLVTLASVIVAGLLIYAESGEGLRLLGLATPELMGWIAAFDIATTADLAMAGLLAWSVRSRGMMRAWIGAIRPARRAKARAKRRQFRTPPKLAANDDENRRPAALAA
ncbi:hypothetical protein [Novosphingopyxis sp. YJ-S2-01]|uniref:hypothetical protein n=1 Tax=Novosphingopyxis sp. YJ-S2-01 TaxID=2794021 RepID=UPI0018DD00DF|nr:hypothetical protein [Novosphingopyxis sp. YJ-S2-01]MBH9538742.1 hypothetical protein [Novosphingopyxis sp. YJ-S2-01]